MRNGICEISIVKIMIVDVDFYMVMIDEKIIVKIGIRYDVGNFILLNYKVVVYGKDYCVWEK